MTTATDETARIYLEQQMTEPVACCVADGECTVYSQRCPGKEITNEDAAAVIPVGESSAVLVVADGCGGMAVGEQAARATVEAIFECIREQEPSAAGVRSGILDGIDLANRRVQQLTGGAGATLVCAQIDGDGMRAFHVGDAAALLVGGRGRIKLYSESHSPVGYALRAGVLDEEQAMLHSERHVVSNIIGTPEMHVEIASRRKLARRDTLLLASDGLFDNLLLQEIADLVCKGPLIDASCRLVGRTIERMTSGSDVCPAKPDDLTFIMFRRSRTRPCSAPPQDEAAGCVGTHAKS